MAGIYASAISALKTVTQFEQALMPLQSSRSLLRTLRSLYEVAIVMLLC
jgi:hypothetical protein